MPFLLLFILIIVSPAVNAEGNSEKPLWEFGILGGGVQTSDYPGSNESEFRGIIFPNFRYRGKIFRSEETEGTRARIYQDEVIRIDFSFDFNFAVDSSQNAARQGMNDIDFVLELGPRVKIRLGSWEDGKRRAFALLPLRKGLQTDLSYLGDAGWTFSPGIQYEWKGVLCDLCQLFTRFSVSLIDSRNSNIFYQVEAKDVSATRSAFNGRSGYNASEFFLGYILRIGKVQGFLGLIHSEYGGSVNRDSPLLVAGSNTTFILGLGWLFWKSDRRGYE